MASEFLTVGEVQAFLRLTSAESIDNVQHVIDATLAHVATRVWVGVGRDTATVTARESARVLILPVVGANELVGVVGPDGVEVPLNTVDSVDLDAGVLTLPRGAARGTYTVTVRFPDAPADVKEACLHIIKHLWSIRRGAQGGARGDVDAQAQIQQGFAIPRRAQELLAPYERVGGFA